MKTNPKAPCWVIIQYALCQVFADLFKKKCGTLLTILVIAVSLTVPTIGFLLWKNTVQATAQFSPDTEISAYLHSSLDERDANLVVNRIKKLPAVESLDYISQQQGLKDFRSWSGFATELDILDDNPLPAVIIIKPTAEYQSSVKRQQLQQQLMQIRGITQVVDNDWLDKLNAIIQLIAHIAIFFAVAMALAVYLVINNIIHAEVQGKQTNIEVMKLLGATDKFILRPFIYKGFIYGLLGAAVAYLFSELFLYYFRDTVHYVTSIFAVNFELKGLVPVEIACLLITCAMIGYFSACTATNKHIKMLEK